MKAAVHDAETRIEGLARASYGLPARAVERARPEAVPADEWNHAAHAGMAAMTFGLSPISLALAALDRGAHLAIAQGKCLDLAARTWLAACLFPATVPVPA
jgi:polyhydroxyalkanoate synthase subunit PhaC